MNVRPPREYLFPGYKQLVIRVGELHRDLAGAQSRVAWLLMPTKEIAQSDITRLTEGVMVILCCGYVYVNDLKAWKRSVVGRTG